VLKNIIDNSIKFSHHTGSEEQSEPICISAEEIKDKVTIKIKDDGIGIPNENLSYVFEPFYRVDKSRARKTGGYGLGLSLCKKIIEAHSGKISIANNNDERGVTVTIEIPK
jgi:signal transduction histidine kinase